MALEYLISCAALALPFSLSAQTTASDVPAASANQSSSFSLALPGGVSRAMLGKRDLRVMAVQVMLDRTRHSPGVIDGYMGGNTRRAIRYFRAANGLPAGGYIDEALLRTLIEEESGDVFQTYTITQDDVNGPFYTIPSSYAEMAKMEKLGYESAREMLAERFHMDAEFLSALNPGVDFTRAGTTINIVSYGDEALQGDIDRIEIRKIDSRVVALNTNGRILASYPATIGSNQFPSPSGRMQVNVIAPAPNYTFDPDDQKWGPDRTFVLPPGPNNPVGAAWIDLGKEGYGIHGSPDPSLIGKTASHGCVRLTNWDAEELLHAVSTGIPVAFV